MASAEARGRGVQIITRLARTIEDEDLRRNFLEQLPVEFRHGGRGDSAEDPFGLSPREVEVLQVAGEGLTDAEIGLRLSISPRTVGRHLQSAYNKIGVNSRTAAVARALENGLIRPTH